MTNERTELKQLWVEKYRPSKMEDYVWIDQNQKKMIEGWVKERYLPQLLLQIGCQYLHTLLQNRWLR